MAVADQVVTEQYAVYNGDCVEIMQELPDSSVGLSVYSPPFGGLYEYSSSERDLSNTKDYAQFFEHFDFVVGDIHRVTKPGRMTCVHAMDILRQGDRGLIDFTGDIIRQHERLGFDYWARIAIWKEPLRVAIRTRAKHLTHRQIVKDASLCSTAGCDFLLVFRKRGENKEPISNAEGLQRYAGGRAIPDGLEEMYRGWSDPQTNKLAHWIWQQYASSVWDDIRIDNVLPFRQARDSDEEKHVHPLQLDVIERCVLLWSNEEDIVLTPFMGVGSEVYGAVRNHRRGIGIELKASYYRQALSNLKDVQYADMQPMLFDEVDLTNSV